MTNDELLTELISAIQSREQMADSPAFNNYSSRATRLETELRTRLAALNPLERTAREYSVGWAPEFALHQAAREYAAQYKPGTENTHA